MLTVRISRSLRQVSRNATLTDSLERTVEYVVDVRTSIKYPPATKYDFLSMLNFTLNHVTAYLCIANNWHIFIWFQNVNYNPVGLHFLFNCSLLEIITILSITSTADINYL